MIDARPNVSDGNRAAALAGEILRVLCGSDVHGMAIDGTDDRDEMGVFIEPDATVLGVGEKADHWNSRTQPHGARSGPGDTDLILYSLRKWMRLATDGNPTVLTVLYAPEDAVLTSSPWGEELRLLAPAIVSQNAAYRYLGYLNGQYERMLGGGKQSRVPNRPELIERYGFDVKYASHALRLGLQGFELATTGAMTLPLPEQDRALCREMKTGGMTFTESCALIEHTRDVLAGLIDAGKTVLRPEPDWDAVNSFMVEAHLTFWQQRDPK